MHDSGRLYIYPIELDCTYLQGVFGSRINHDYTLRLAASAFASTGLVHY